MTGPKPHIPPVELLRFHTEPRACSYLPSETACLEYKVIAQITPGQYLHMLQRGWRRFGIMFFRPACRACNKCISLRVCNQTFKPSRSQQRTLKNNEDIEVIVRPASCTSDHVELFNLYHGFMQEHRGWAGDAITPQEYAQHFLSPFSFALEFLYLKQDKLVGVGLVDIVPGAVSSIYFYHHPDWRKAGPGVFSLLQEIEYGRKMSAEFSYLGYWIKENRSMQYKSQYRPHQTLHGLPSDGEEPAWIAETQP